MATESEKKAAVSSEIVKAEVPASKIQVATKEKIVIDREKTCPFLLRMFAKDNLHHRLEEFTKDTQPFSDELQIYTWRDATFKELSNLIKEVNADARRRDVGMSFQLIFVNSRGRYESREIGTVSNSKKNDVDEKTLDEVRFVTGDFLDVAIIRERRLSGSAVEPRGRDRERDSRNDRDSGRFRDDRRDRR